MGRKIVEFFARRTDVDIALGVILELLRAEECGAVVVVGRRNVGMYVLMVESDKVLFCPVLAVTGGLSGPQLPAEAREAGASPAWVGFPTLRRERLRPPELCALCPHRRRNASGSPSANHLWSA